MTSKKPRKVRASEATTPSLTPQAFLEGLYGLAPGQRMPDGVYGWLATFSDIIDDAPRWVWTGRPWTGGDPLEIPAMPGIRGTFDRDNTYAVISAFRPENDGELGRRKHLYVAGFAVMLDDLGTKVEMKSGLALPPSYLIETSPSNFQSWLFFAEPIEDRERHEALLDALVRSGLSLDGTDPGMRGVTRYGRMPFGVNTKKKYGEGGFTVRLHEWAPERRYTLAEIVKGYGLELVPPKRRRLGPPPLRETQDARAQEFATLRTALHLLGLYKREQRSGWHEVTCPWAEEHTDGRDDGAAIAEPSEANGWRGGYRCHHGHCAKRGIADVRREVMALLTRMVGSGQ